MTEALPRRIYFDSNVYICALETNSDISRLVFRLFGGWQWQNHQIVTSEFTPTEVLVHPIERALNTGDYRLHDSYTSLIADEDDVRQVVKLDRNILVRSALVRAQMSRLSNRKLKTPDAIHVASALSARCDTFVTGDEALLRAVADICNRVGLEPGESEPSLKYAVGLSVSDLSRLAEELKCP